MPLSVKIKWPNDLMWEDQKLAGFLLEKTSSENHFILGLGLNVNHAPLLNKPHLYSPCCLKDFLQEPLSINHLCFLFLEQFTQDLEVFEKQGLAPFLAPLEVELYRLKQTITLCDDDQNQEDIKILGLNKMGFLLSLTSSGVIKPIFAGDLVP